MAWTYRTGALQPETPLNAKAAFEATPILVDGKLFLSTPYNQVIALDPADRREALGVRPGDRSLAQATPR